MAARFNKAKDVFRDIETKFERAVNQFLYKLNREVTKLTPRRSGRAARGWRLMSSYKIGRTQVVIENRVPYIGLLEMGYSRQAPNGMITPAMNRLKRRTYKV